MRSPPSLACGICKETPFPQAEFLHFGLRNWRSLGIVNIQDAENIFSSCCYWNQRKRMLLHEILTAFAEGWASSAFGWVNGWVVLLDCFLELCWEQCFINCFQLQYWASSGQCWVTLWLTLKARWAFSISRALRSLNLWIKYSMICALKATEFNSANLWLELDMEELILCGSLSSSATVDDGCIFLLSCV